MKVKRLVDGNPDVIAEFERHAAAIEALSVKHLEMSADITAKYEAKKAALLAEFDKEMEPIREVIRKEVGLEYDKHDAIMDSFPHIEEEVPDDYFNTVFKAGC